MVGVDPPGEYYPLSEDFSLGPYIFKSLGVLARLEP